MPFDLDAGRVRRLNEVERAAFEAYLDPAEPLRPLPKVGVGESAARYPLTVRWSDLDAFGHVNNVKFYDYVQEARVAIMTAASTGRPASSGRSCARTSSTSRRSTSAASRTRSPRASSRSGRVVHPRGRDPRPGLGHRPRPVPHRRRRPASARRGRAQGPVDLGPARGGGRSAGLNSSAGTPCWCRHTQLVPAHPAGGADARTVCLGEEGVPARRRPCRRQRRTRLTPRAEGSARVRAPRGEGDGRRHAAAHRGRGGGGALGVDHEVRGALEVGPQLGALGLGDVDRLDGVGMWVIQRSRMSGVTANGACRIRRRGWPRSSLYVVGPPQYCSRNPRSRSSAGARSSSG